jgi:hypothetical protein
MSPFKLDAVVGAGGKLELTVPLPPGTAVEILVRDPEAPDEAPADLEWNDHLQERLDALDRDGVDPRPWREVMDELRTRLGTRRDRP